jgi:hypothetical protein
MSLTCLQGGGFCGARTKPLNLDLSNYDGLQMRVKGDGQIFKFNIKTVSACDLSVRDVGCFLSTASLLFHLAWASKCCTGMNIACLLACLLQAINIPQLSLVEIFV